MKPVASYGIVNADTSGPGAFLRAAKWYWDELTDMFAAAGFRSVMIPMVPNTENVSRNGAPICTASVKTRFGSPAGYLAYLNDKGIDNVEAIGDIYAEPFAFPRWLYVLIANTNWNRTSRKNGIKTKDMYTKDI